MYWKQPANIDEIIVLELDMQLIGNQNSLHTLVRRIENVRLLTLEVEPTCSVYELDKRLALNNEIRV